MNQDVEVNARSYLGRGCQVIVVLVGVALYWLFTYNSGYGYDALEYLVIGRSLVSGYEMYHFAPSKSFGLYYLVAAFQSVGLAQGHAGVATAVTLMLFALSAVTYWVVRRFFGGYAAVVTVLLVVACAAFMEQNYLEPEGMVALCGMVSFFMAVRAFEGHPLRRLFLAGLLISCGFHFKSVSAFYGFGMLLWLVVTVWAVGPVRDGLLKWVPALCLGALTGLLVPVVYFGITGRLDSFWLWTVEFPLFHYKSSAKWIPKMYTKLMWFPVLTVGLITVSLVSHRIRRSIYGSRPATLALALGLTSLLVLLKKQSPHYYFPGAVFVSVFAGAVVCSIIGRATPSKRGVRSVVLSGICVVLLLATSAYLYRPSTIKRLVQVRSFDEHRAIGEFVRQYVDADQRAMFFAKPSTLLYWVGDRYPNTPALSLDAHNLFLLNRHPDTLVDALDDPAVTLVEYDPRARWRMPYEFFYDRPEYVNLVDRAHDKLQKGWVRLSEGPGDMVFWVRRAGPSAAE